MYKVKRIDLCAGEFTVILHEKDAKELGVRNSDRVRVVGPNNSITAIVETTDSIVASDEVGLLEKGFNALDIKNGQVGVFKEKPKGDGAMINGGFFVLSPNVLNRISGDDCIWEQQPLMGLADDGQLMAYEHHGFWQPMDTLRDKIHLEELWQSGNPPWKTWE